jgi:hypothetical protein
MHRQSHSGTGQLGTADSELEAEIADLRCQIENRVKEYNIQMEERAMFGEHVESLNDA